MMNWYHVIVRIEGWNPSTSHQKDEVGQWGDVIRAFNFLWRRLPDGPWHGND
jgi:hypothetical protein